MAINIKRKAVHLVLVTFVLICVHQSTGSEGTRMNKKNLETVDRSRNEIKENVTIPVEYTDSVTQSVDIDNEITAKKEHVTAEKKTFLTTNDAKVQGTFTTQSSKPTMGHRERGKGQTTTKPQTKTPTTPTIRQDRIDSMDQYLLDGILDIVDEKFSTLNKRLMTLERGVNNLQYYNVRSFRVVNTHLHAVDTILHTIHSQIGQNEQQNKIIEQSVGALKNEITDLQSMNSGMFQAIEQNLVLFHQDIEQRISSVQDSVEESNIQLSQLNNVTADMKTGIEQIENLQVKAEQNSETSMILASNILEKSTLCVNTTSDTFVLTETINKQTKKLGDTIGNISETVSILSTDTLEIKQGLSSALTNISVAKVNKDQFGVGEDDIGDNYKEFRATNSKIQMPCGKMLEILDDKLKHINVTLSEGQQKDDKCDNKGNIPVDFKNQSRKLLRALSTVNENIFQSVTLYRHTGNLIERVISDTELIASEQVRLREELVAYLLNGTFDLFNHTIPDFADVIATRGKNSEANANETQTCAVTKSVIDEVLKLSFNGTQLVQMLTDLATTSSSSIQLSIDKLDKEIGRLNKIQSETLPPLYQRHETYIRDDPKAGSNNQIKDIQNKTDWIYQLSEAIASNTGWIPYVFHNLRFVENQVNKTLKLVTSIDTRSEEMLVRQRANMAIMFKPKQPSTQSPVVKKQITETNADDRRGTPADSVSCVVNASQNTLFEQMMTYVYNTNRKLNRLVPALTNLLGEPGR